MLAVSYSIIGGSLGKTTMVCCSNGVNWSLSQLYMYIYPTIIAAVFCEIPYQPSVCLVYTLSMEGMYKFKVKI